MRTVKQGIDYSIANHLEYLTSKWPRPEQMSLSSREMYRRGEELCQSWTKQVNTPKPTMFIDDSTADSIEPWDEDDSTVESTSSMTPTLQAPTKNRYRFDDTMLDCHGRIIVVKVYSHQLNKDFTVKTAGMQPSPNMFVTSSNQYADNAADQAMKIFENYDMTEYKQCFYPPFSPRWSFSFEGCITNKGATKVLQDKMDEELIQRQQLRVKQGLFLRMSPFHSLKTDQIGDESILRNLLKMTAMCWTRSGYRDPKLPQYIWSFWRHSAYNAHKIDTIPATIPKDWKKNANICDNIIKACPFCSSFDVENNKKGNLEHLHLYCPSRHLKRVRDRYNANIEDALRRLYDFISYREKNCAYNECARMCTLQENLIAAAKETELLERPTVQQSQIIMEARSTNIAIRSEHEAKMLVCLNQLPASKLSDYQQFPLCCQLGFIPAIPEAAFDVATATVTDVAFLGFFPKRIYQELRRCAREIENSTPTEGPEFKTLFNELIDAFIRRSVMIQRVIHMLIAKQRQGLEKLAKRREAAALSSSNGINNKSQRVLTPEGSASTPALPTRDEKRPCHATKCRILRAKGIVLRQQHCITGRSMCAGCNNEAAKQRKTRKMEQEILIISVKNDVLAPLLELLKNPVSIKRFRQLFACLPSLAPKKSREDCIFGAARYLANTFGFQLEKTHSANLIDEILPIKAVQQLWRQASFICRCSPPPQKDMRESDTIRSFCSICSFLTRKIHSGSLLSCPSCQQQDSWKVAGAPCLSCQFASIVHRNPFSKRYSTLQNIWLPMLDDSDTSSSSACPATPPSPPTCASVSPTSQEQLKKLRQAALDESMDSIRTKSSPEENKFVFDNLALLRKQLQDEHVHKRDFDSILSDSIGTIDIDEENLSPRKKGTSTKQLFSDDSNCSRDAVQGPRFPLLPIDMNVWPNSMPTSQNGNESHTKRITGRQKKFQDRTMRAKEKKNQGKR